MPFDDRETKQNRRERDKLAAVWGQVGSEITLFIYNPVSHVTADERLVPLDNTYQAYWTNTVSKYGQHVMHGPAIPGICKCRLGEVP